MSAITTTNTNANGILGGWATYNGENWAVANGDGTAISALGTYTTTTNVAADYLNGNMDVGVASTLTGAGTINTNSLRFSGASSKLLTLDAGDNIIQSGGILVRSDVAAGTSTISGGNIAGSSGGDLTIHQHNSTTALTINSIIKNNGTATGLTKSGVGTLILSGANIFTGNTTINAGQLSIGSNNTAGARLGPATYAGNIFIASGASLVFNTDQSQTLSGIISGNGTLQKAGGGTLTLSGNNTYTGKTSVAAVNGGGPSLSVSSFNSINGGTPLLSSSSLGAPTTVANGTITIGNGSNVRSCTLIYTGAGETTDRVIDIQHNNGNTHAITASNTAGLVKFTSNFTTGGGSGTPSFTLNGSTANSRGEIAGIIPSFFSGVTIRKEGTGTWIFSGANTYVNPTNILLGTLIARSSSALGTSATANVSITAGASATGLNYVAATDTALNIGGTLTINGGANTFIGGSIGSTATSARINVAGNALVPTAAVKVNVYGVSGASRLAGTNTYTLVSGLGGGATTLNNGTYTLGTVFNNTDFTVANITKSTTDLMIDVTKQTALNSATYYVGGLAGATNVWAASNGSSSSNFATSSGGTSQALVPGSAASVVIDSNSNATSTVLGADMAISGLTISDNTNNFALNADGYGLTIGTGGITKNNTTTKTATIASNIVLGGAQTWSNSDTGNALVVSGIVTGANNLAVGGAGNTTVSGRLMTGAGTLTKSGNGTLSLTSHNTYTGATTVAGGSLIVNGNISTSSLTTVDVGATLGGSGVVGKTVINGTLAVGNSPGTMTFTDTLTLAGIDVVEIDGTSGAGVTGGHDFVNLTGGGAAGVLTYGGTMTLDLGVIFAAGSYTWDLFDMASETATFTTIALADQYAGSLLDGDTNGVWDLASGNDTWQFTESTGVLSLTVIPEPGAALLGSLGILLIFRRRR